MGEQVHRFDASSDSAEGDDGSSSEDEDEPVEDAELIVVASDDAALLRRCRDEYEQKKCSCETCKMLPLEVAVRIMASCHQTGFTHEMRSAFVRGALLTQISVADPSVPTPSKRQNRRGRGQTTRTRFKNYVCGVSLCRSMFCLLVNCSHGLIKRVGADVRSSVEGIVRPSRKSLKPPKSNLSPLDTAICSFLDNYATYSCSTRRHRVEFPDVAHHDFDTPVLRNLCTNDQADWGVRTARPGRAFHVFTPFLPSNDNISVRPKCQ